MINKESLVNETPEELEKIRYVIEEIIKEISGKRITNQKYQIKYKEVVCPKCKCQNNIVRNGHKNGTQRYKCKNCNNFFSITTNTILSHTKLNYTQLKTYIKCLINLKTIKETAKEVGISETEKKLQGTFNLYDYKKGAVATSTAKSRSISCYSDKYQAKYNGWRVLDVSSSGQITLIHAGTPECYYHKFNYSSESVSILSNKSTASNPGTSKAWNKYGNTTYAESVHYFDGTDWNTLTTNMGKKITVGECIDKGTTPVCGEGNDIIDIGVYYWISSGSGGWLDDWSISSQISKSCDISFGVRPVVVLKPGVKFKANGYTGSSQYSSLDLVAP